LKKPTEWIARKTSRLIETMARQYTIHRPTAKLASGIDYAKELNAEQYAAVSSPDGRALVIAGAGSGKTRTLTFRVAWLLDHAVEARNILLLTFTNKAAREMIERVRELVPQDTSDLWAGTFHSIGSRILRKHADEIGFTRSFTILDRDDQKSMVNALVSAMDVKKKSLRFPKADVILGIISLVENTGKSLESMLDDGHPHLENWFDEIETIHRNYKQKKIDSNSMDFDDLLVRTVALLQDRPDLLALYQKKFRHVLVDEYQDTNTVQCALIDLLVGETNSVMVVGDDAQSIYSWRGANMANILRFPESGRPCRTFAIETNYRSVPEILDLSNEAIRANTERFDKNLHAARASENIKPALVNVDDPFMQAAFVAQRINEIMDEDGIPADEIAVLYRAHFQSMEVQMALTSRGVPFQITSGLRFFEQAHIKDVSAFLRFVCNRRDEVAFTRMVLLFEGVGPTSAAKLWRAWCNTGWAERDTPPESFSATLAKFPIPKKAQDEWRQLGYILDEMWNGVAFAKPADMIYSVVEGFYGDFIKDSFENGEQRRSDVDKLRDYANGFEDILEFLEQLSLLSNTDGQQGGNKKQDDDTPKITLSSIHQAKGLEWKVVFLIGLVEGQFPIGRVMDCPDHTMVEEERRLFYVGITRARDQLYMTYPMVNPKSYTGEYTLTPSRFLSDFPIDMVETWNTGSNYEEEDAPF
jgi:DNA helicase II / ATP-dependent DNA helicase PcrA